MPKKNGGYVMIQSRTAGMILKNIDVIVSVLLLQLLFIIKITILLSLRILCVLLIQEKINQNLRKI